MKPDHPTDAECFDVVDADDKVIAVKTRSVVHRERLYHRAVHVFVFNGAGQVFLQRRSMTKDTAPGKWVSSCSGHVDSGEDYDEAARRELAEELGMGPPRNLRRMFRERPCKQTGYEFVWVYTCESEGPFHLHPGEISEGQWIAPDHLHHWLKAHPRDFAWSFVHLWDRFRREIMEAGPMDGASARALSADA